MIWPNYPFSQIRVNSHFYRNKNYYEVLVTHDKVASYKSWKSLFMNYNVFICFLIIKLPKVESIFNWKSSDLLKKLNALFRCVLKRLKVDGSIWHVHVSNIINLLSIFLHCILQKSMSSGVYSKETKELINYYGSLYLSISCLLIGWIITLKSPYIIGVWIQWINSSIWTNFCLYK
jgi:hypothetical protein